MALHYEIWDKKSEVNRFPADEFMRQHGIKEDDQVYLIKQGLRTMCVQTDFDSPYADGERTIEEMAKMHLAEFQAAENARLQDPAFQKFLDAQNEEGI